MNSKLKNELKENFLKVAKKKRFNFCDLLWEIYKEEFTTYAIKGTPVSQIQQEFPFSNTTLSRVLKNVNGVKLK